MCKPAIVKEREKNAKKLTVKNVLLTKNIMKYSKILKLYILNPNYKVKSSNWQSFATKGSSLNPQNRDYFFILISKGPNSS